MKLFRNAFYPALLLAASACIAQTKGDVVAVIPTIALSWFSTATRARIFSRRCGSRTMTGKRGTSFGCRARNGGKDNAEGQSCGDSARNERYLRQNLYPPP